MRVANTNGAKVYNLTSEKSLPAWITERRRRSFAKDEEYIKRLELIQDFEMPTACDVIKMTGDCEHIIVSGTYPPCVKCYTISDLSLKFHRGLTCGVISVETLSEDFGKLVFLQSNRTLNFHAPYGNHYSLRIPKFGRCMQYELGSCDLYVSAAGNEIYRLNLEEGRFKAPMSISFSGCNKIHLNPVHPLLACGGESHMCEFWDVRSKNVAGKLNIKRSIGSNRGMNITEVKFDESGLSFGVGTSGGECILYDIRSARPSYIKKHPYGFPVFDIQFHNQSKTVLSTDKKVLKIWEREGDTMGNVVTNIETPANINMAHVVRDQRGQSGLILIAGEQKNVMSYYVPRLGPAPRWCSFLEGITEELEESSRTNVYEDYKFLSKSEVDDLGASSLIGTSMLKAYMHGFFMEMKLYSKLCAVSKPFEYEKYLKKKIDDKIEQKRRNRIIVKKRLPKVNINLAARIISKNNTGRVEILDDERFSGLFDREDFEQDPNSHEYKLRNPNKGMNGTMKGDDEVEHEFQNSYASMYKHGNARSSVRRIIGTGSEVISVNVTEAEDPKMLELTESVSLTDATFGHAMNQKRKSQTQKQDFVPFMDRMEDVGAFKSHKLDGRNNFKCVDSKSPDRLSNIEKNEKRRKTVA